jgi:hypothetical protein
VAGQRDAIGFAEKVLELLDEGRYTATYKYAVLLALIDLCLEGTQASGAPPAMVTTRQLADKIVEIYWPHTVPFARRSQAGVRRAHPPGRCLVTRRSGAPCRFSPSAIPRQGVEHVQRIADVQALAEPASSRAVRVQLQSLRFVPGPDRLDRVVRDGHARWDMGDRITVWILELQLAVRLPFDLVALLVDGAVMSPT